MGDTALSRAVRTFAALMVGPLVAAAAINWFGGDAKLGSTKLTLAVIAAALAAASAYALAQSRYAPDTPLGRALATLLQGLGAGLATVVVADLTEVAAVEAVKQVGGIVIASALAAVHTLAVHVAGKTESGA
jgi:hypothetical protein